MKWILIFAVILLPKISQAQVTIPDDVARYYLEQNDKAIIYEKKDSVSQVLISNLHEQVVTQKMVNETYEMGFKSLRIIIETKDAQLTLKDKEIKQLKRKARNQTVARWLERSGYVAILIIIL